MESRLPKRMRSPVDPVALLQREHDVIRGQLGMIDSLIGSSAARCRPPAAETRDTLRELMEFFTSRAGVHFKREALLITTLRRFLNRKEGEGSQFQCLLEEHRKLKAQATAVMCRLQERGRETGRAPLSSSARRDEMESVARELRTFVRRYRAHLSCEERILFVLAEMRLAAEQKERLSFRMLQV